MMQSILLASLHVIQSVKLHDLATSRAVLQVMDPDLCVSNNCGNECVH